MNGYDDITPQVRAWLNEPVSLREDGIGEVALTVHQTPQQRGLLPPLAVTRLGGVWSRSTGLVVASTVVALLGGLLLAGLLAGPGRDKTAAGAPPDWRGVEFEPVEAVCAAGCDWDTGGVWSVGAAHHGDIGSTQAIAFGSSGAPWFLSDDSVWQLGVPGGGFVSPMSSTHDLDVTRDGVLWVASDLGLQSYDGTDWISHWNEMPLYDVHVAPDGTVYAVGGGRGHYAVTVVRHDEVGTASAPVDVIGPDRYPTSIAVDADGRVWVSAIESGWLPPAEGASLVAYTDGGEWHTARPLGAGTDVATFSLVHGPDGSIWSLLWALSPQEGILKSLARFDGQDWSVRAVPIDDTRDFGNVDAIDPAGTAWFIAGGERQDGLAGVLAFDGSTWTRYLGDLWFGALALAPDGTVLVTTVPGLDEEGQLFAIRHAPSLTRH